MEVEVFGMVRRRERGVENASVLVV